MALTTFRFIAPIGIAQSSLRRYISDYMHIFYINMAAAPKISIFESELALLVRLHVMSSKEGGRRENFLQNIVRLDYAGLMDFRE